MDHHLSLLSSLRIHIAGFDQSCFFVQISFLFLSPVGPPRHTSALWSHLRVRTGSQFQPVLAFSKKIWNVPRYLVGYHRADIAVRVVEGLSLVRLAMGRPDLAVSTTHDDRTW